ncbi:hypothetical protein EON63_04460 [archaeon]|nr:MAG: hypothetical protein EON63_04460 [archaeon]
MVGVWVCNNVCVIMICMCMDNVIKLFPSSSPPGIFHNDTQTALCWVNEEDHCRIISMELGGDIPSVFKR